MIQVQTPAGLMQVQIPMGLQAGQVFQMQIPAPQPQMPMAQPVQQPMMQQQQVMMQQPMMQQPQVVVQQAPPPQQVIIQQQQPMHYRPTTHVVHHDDGPGFGMGLAVRRGTLKPPASGAPIHRSIDGGVRSSCHRVAWLAA